MANHGSVIRSSNVAERALTLILNYLKAESEIVGAPKVGDFGVARQDDFMRWCRDKYKLSCKTISTYLSMYKAALKYCSRPHLVVDSMGKKREAQILAYAPFVNDGEKYVTKVTGLPLSVPRSWIPNDDELRAFLDAIYTDASTPDEDSGEHIWRYAVIQLNTWARPEAIFDLSIKDQVNIPRQLINLNPTGRTQTKKYRPTIRLTNTLSGWIQLWNVDKPICNSRGVPYKDISNRTLQKIAKRAGIDEWKSFTSYTLRHYMNTRVRRVAGQTVSREERAEWIGHKDASNRTTQDWYETFDPDYLVNVANAIDLLMVELSTKMRKSLISPKLLPSVGTEPLKINAK